MCLFNFCNKFPQSVSSKFLLGLFLTCLPSSSRDETNRLDVDVSERLWHWREGPRTPRTPCSTPVEGAEARRRDAEQDRGLSLGHRIGPCLPGPAPWRVGQGVGLAELCLVPYKGTDLPAARTESRGASRPLPGALRIESTSHPVGRHEMDFMDWTWLFSWKT